MLVKTPRHGESQPWISQLGSKNNVVSSTLRHHHPEIETTVTVYYQCEPLAAKHEAATMRGARRVMTFCLLAACLPVMLLIVPLYLRNYTFAERHFSLMKYDVIPLSDGISSCFCQRHTVQALEGWFSAYAMQEAPKSGSEWRLSVNDSSMAIPDDRLEYWGFVLLPGSTINLTVCARNPGANLLVVRGERNLELCGLLQYSSPVKPIQLPTDNESVFVVHRQETTMADNIETTMPPTDEIEEEENLGGEITDPPDSDVTMTPHLVRHLRSKLRHQRDLMSTFPPSDMKLNLIKVPSEIKHGGNTVNFLDQNDGGSSISSFETDLLNCFYGKVLFQGVLDAGGKMCENTNSTWPGVLHLTQTINSQDHYYYVFYSDNDVENNTLIHARFEVNATTYDFNEATSGCNNVTQCLFNKTLLGGDGEVYVEAVSDVLLVSICEPRLGVYLIFPVCALLLVLTFGLL